MVEKVTFSMLHNKPHSQMVNSNFAITPMMCSLLSHLINPPESILKELTYARVPLLKARGKSQTIQFIALTKTCSAQVRNRLALSRQ